MAKTIVSIIVLLIGLINMALNAFGITQLDIDAETISNAVSIVAVIAGAIGTTWKNANLTDPAKAAQVALDNLKAGNIDINEFVKMTNELIDETGKLKKDSVK